MSEEQGPGRGERRARETMARFRAEAEEYVGPQLQADEKIVAVLLKAMTRPIYPLIGLFGLIGLRAYAVVVTDRRVLFVRLGLSKWEPRALEDAFARDQVRVVEWRPTSRISGTGLALLVLDRAGQPFKLRPEPNSGADELVDALGGVVG